MRVLQLIDSLEAGGAERVAVNLANALAKKIDKSFLCTTRKEGVLKESLNNGVKYLFLGKKGKVDLKAILKLKTFVKRNKIDIIHAHSTSFFLAILMKFINTKLSVIWHDHYGKCENLDEREFRIIRFCSQYFAHIFSVNSTLELWAKNNLKTKKVSYLPNFAVSYKLEPNTLLKGENGKRILHLANLRPQKDHITLFKAFSIVLKKYPNWTLHCIGKDFGDDYSKNIKAYISENGLEKQVFVYGSCNDITYILNQSNIGVLSSKSEGLPMALLEYGLNKLPVVATNVGDCNKVLSKENEGILIDPKNHIALANGMLNYINDKNLREEVTQNLHQKVLSSFSETSSIESLIKVYKQYV